jgi:hypothetical protein
MKLSKREALLLVLLLVIALVFIEFRFIITPGMNKIYRLSDKKDEQIGQLEEIDMNLKLATMLQEKMKGNMKSIQELAAPFLDGVSPDVLLVFTHDMLMKHGFTPYIYTPVIYDSEALNPAQAEVSLMTYRIKEIAREYKNIGKQTGSEQPTPTPTPSVGNNDSSTGDKGPTDAVERYSLRVSATGTYEQIKALLDDYESLGRGIVISVLKMTQQSDVTVVGPTPTLTPGAVPTPAPGILPDTILEIEFQVDYYGIEKLTDSQDPLSQWSRETQPAGTDDPYSPFAKQTSETTAAVNPA